MSIIGLSVKAGGALLAGALALASAATPAAATSTTATATTATKAAAADKCTLTIQQLLILEYYQVSVSCTDGNVNRFKLYGSDGWPNPDDYLTEITGRTSLVKGDLLNEDIGARDEIYAKAYYTTPAGVSKSRNTNRVDGYYGCTLILC